MQEQWAVIQEFPNYQVSNLGRVINTDTGKFLKESKTSAGVAKIGLVRGGVQFTRSVKVLVAEIFVEGQDNEFNTPINLDGDPSHNHADNLAWRPRGFAWLYTRQFIVISHNHDRGPIIDVSTKEVYKDMFDAAISNGLLVDDVWRSIHAKKPTFPTWQMFDFA